MTIKEGVEGFPEDNDLLSAITVYETMLNSVVTLARLDSRYVQMIIDRLSMTALVMKDPKHRECCGAFAVMLTNWLDDRK